MRNRRPFLYANAPKFSHSPLYSTSQPAAGDDVDAEGGGRVRRPRDFFLLERA